MLVASGAACDESPTRPSDLIGERWRLTAIERAGLPVLSPPAGRQFTLEFMDAGRLGVRADCNSCGGSYELHGSNLTIRPLACTRAFCGTDSLDTPFLQALGEARAVHRDASELTIRAGTTSLRFSLE
jgi:heat shock protein HslJ